MSKEILENLRTAIRFIKEQFKFRSWPEVGIVLGTGLGSLGDVLEDRTGLFYKEIPNFPVSTVESHEGKLILGNIDGRDVAILQGRVHLYEGYSPQQVCFGVRVLGMLGTRILILTNAAGAINPEFEEGNIMVISDHINFTGKNPLVGPNIDELGERFPDMSRVYDEDLISLAISCGIKIGLRLEKGVYVCVLGPSLETPAETRALRKIGADAVGMSTVMEAIAARHMGIKVLGLSCLTNKNLPDCMRETSFEYIVQQANRAGQNLQRLLIEILKEL
jgi:purine-nucleoside phosphorylase